MDEIDRQQRVYAGDAAKKYRQGRITRREFFRRCAQAVFGFSSLYFLSQCTRTPAPPPTAARVQATVGPNSASVPRTDAQKFLQEVGAHYKGTTLRIVSEDTPPSRAI